LLPALDLFEELLLHDLLGFFDAPHDLGLDLVSPLLQLLLDTLLDEL
jgi:hypothetical protein